MANEQMVYIVDDDEGIREALGLLLETVDLPCELFASAIDFLDTFDQSRRGCLVLDIRMPRMTGLDLQKTLVERGISIPIIFITGHGDIPMAVEAMRRGAMDFIRKPFREQEILDSINRALETDLSRHVVMQNEQMVLDKVGTLSDREREVFNCVARGDMNKVIGIDLGISERTVEVHRAQVMKKLEVKTLAELVRINIEFEKLASSEGD